MQEYLTVQDVQKILRIGRDLSYEIVSRPDFPKIKVGRCYRIPADKFEKWLRHMECAS